MTEKDFLLLQNGSDVRGVAMAGVPGENVNLSGEAVNRIAIAFVKWLAERAAKPNDALKIAVGVDSRLTGAALKAEILRGILSTGATAVDCGLASSPAMFMSVAFPDVAMDGAIMITASHLPFNRNGMKFFNGDGGLEKVDIRTLLKTATRTMPGKANIKQAASYDLIGRYCRHLRELICTALERTEADKPLKDMHVVIDAGNGAGGFFAAEVLEPLGANTLGSCYLMPDGMFPNHIPNPENEEAMASIRKAVLDNEADLGLIFDTDVDRMSAVLPDGTAVNRNALIAMVAAILAPDYPHSTIVTDSVTSDELTEFLTGELGLVHHRFKRGYKNVIDECKRLNQTGVVSPLAIETSGHGAMKENYYLDDGAYLAVKLLIAAAEAKRDGRELRSLIEKLKYPAESREFRLPITGVDDVGNYGNWVLQKLVTKAEAADITIAKPSYEGVRLVFGEGWALLRKSLHDPLMPLNIEGRRPGSVRAIASQLKVMLEDCRHLGINKLEC